MIERLKVIRSDGENNILSANTENELQSIKVSLLGKEGVLTGLLKEIPKLEPALRSKFGQEANVIKKLFVELIESRREEIKLKESEIPVNFDYTLPSMYPHNGGLHPITQINTLIR